MFHENAELVDSRIFLAGLHDVGEDGRSRAHTRLVVQEDLVEDMSRDIPPAECLVDVLKLVGELWLSERRKGQRRTRQGTSKDLEQGLELWISGERTAAPEARGDRSTQRCIRLTAFETRDALDQIPVYVVCVELLVDVPSVADRVDRNHDVVDSSKFIPGLFLSEIIVSLPV